MSEMNGNLMQSDVTNDQLTVSSQTNSDWQPGAYEASYFQPSELGSSAPSPRIIGIEPQDRSRLIEKLLSDRSDLWQTLARR
jgi:hypothetical protein